MLKRYTQLKRSSTPLKRTPIARVSRKHRAELKAYSAKRKDFLERHPICSAGSTLAAALHPAAGDCTTEATQVHHSHRRGVNLNVEAFFIPICAQCHNWLETHAGEARKLGLLK